MLILVLRLLVLGAITNLKKGEGTTMKKKNIKKNSDGRRCFVALAAKVRNSGGPMGDRRKKRSKEKEDVFAGWM